MAAQEIHNILLASGNREKAAVLQRFFKTGPGEYGEGDVFLGIQVPTLRKLSVQYQNISLSDTGRLLKSSIHEQRLLALLILVRKYSTGNESEKKKIYELYLKSTQFINSWDLVDVTAAHIVGAFLIDKSRKPLYRLAKSDVLWERRISIISTFHFIKHNEFSETLKIAGMLMSDEEDLIHKAVGWMLREIGKRHLPAEENFLRKYYRKMPRTMLRYSIEKFPESKRQSFLKGRV